MNQPEAGEIRPVFGGYELMKVLRYDPEYDAAEMLGHGSQKGHWFDRSVLGEPVEAETVLMERSQARARKVDCNSPDCWCREFKESETSPR